MTFPCGHLELHRCQSCNRCNSCYHVYVKRADGTWWKRCPNLKWVKV